MHLVLAVTVVDFHIRFDLPDGFRVSVTADQVFYLRDFLQVPDRSDPRG